MTREESEEYQKVVCSALKDILKKKVRKMKVYTNERVVESEKRCKL